MNGTWTCEEKEIEIPDSYDHNGDLETYSGKESFFLYKMSLYKHSISSLKYSYGNGYLHL